MPGIHPKTWEDGVMPLEEFPEAKRREIERLVALPRPPARWLNFGIGQIESRAWYEWHWARGQKLQRVPGSKHRRKLTAKKRQMVIDRDNSICGICGDLVPPHDIHIDHIHPYSLGGRDDLDNLQVAHSLCNIRKGARV